MLVIYARNLADHLLTVLRISAFRDLTCLFIFLRLVDIGKFEMYEASVATDFFCLKIVHLLGLGILVRCSIFV